MKCKQLVWDYSAGEIICADNGVVVGRIYSYEPVREEWDGGGAERRLRDDKLRRLRRRLSAKYRLLRLARSISSDPRYVVDYDKLFMQGRFVFTVYSVKSLRVVEWFEKQGLKPVLDSILNALIEREPQLFARTLRAKYLLAYLVYHHVHGYSVRYEDLDGLGEYVSKKTFGCMEKLARRLAVKYKDVIKEAVKK